VVLSGDLSRALVPTCEDGTMVIRTWSLDTGAVDVVAEVEDGCTGFNWYPALPMALSTDGRTAVVGSRVSGELVRIDVDSAQWTSIEAHEAVDVVFFGQERLLNVAMDAAGELAATSGADGMVRVWSLKEMALVAEFRSRAVTLNLDSYQPTVASAVSWSPDGRLLVHLDESGDVLVRRSSDWSIVESIARPVTENAEHFGGDEFVVNAPVQFAWTDDVAGLAISFDQGIALWECRPEPVPVGEPLRVVLDGPTEGQVGQDLRFTATHLGEANLHGHTFLIDGESLGLGFTERELQWTPEAPGRYEVSVIVEDGVSEGSATLVLQVH